MKHFQPSEFGVWWPQMAQAQLESLDRFRELWGAPVTISAAAGTLGRHAGPSKSAHNVDQWGQVFAADIFPHGMVGAKDALRAVACAYEAGFRGIGVYPDWRMGSLRGGLHVDRRDAIQAKFSNYAPGRDFDADPALWSRFGRDYGPIDAALPRGTGRPELLKLWRATS